MNTPRISSAPEESETAAATLLSHWSPRASLAITVRIHSCVAANPCTCRRMGSQLPTRPTPLKPIDNTSIVTDPSTAASSAATGQHQADKTKRIAANRIWKPGNMEVEEGGTIMTSRDVLFRNGRVTGYRSFSRSTLKPLNSGENSPLLNVRTRHHSTQTGFPA